MDDRSQTGGESFPAHHLQFWTSVADDPSGGSVVSVVGELDANSAPKLRDALESAIEGGGEVELDMRACSFVDSTGIATLVWAARRLGDEERTLRIRGAQRRVKDILELSGVLQHHWVTLEDD